MLSSWVPAVRGLLSSAKGGVRIFVRSLRLRREGLRAEALKWIGLGVGPRADMFLFARRVGVNWFIAWNRGMIGEGSNAAPS